MPAPRIGIPALLDTSLRPGRRSHVVDAAYSDAIADAGGVPQVLIGPGDAAARVAEIDGLLVPGGDDILPEASYPSVSFTPVHASQLAFDRALVEHALAAGVPIFGVCYGMQLLALAAGGRLHYHLPHDLPDAHDHGATGRNVRHPVAIETNTRLAAILGAEQSVVDSRHHQAVADPGTLHVSARAGDGVIEAIEGPNVLGVQWHPETSGGESSARLYASLVDAASPSGR